MSMKSNDYDLIAEVIARAIGPSDPYPNKAQIAAHRAKQALKDMQFPIIESEELNK